MGSRIKNKISTLVISGIILGTLLFSPACFAAGYNPNSGVTQPVPVQWPHQSYGYSINPFYVPYNTCITNPATYMPNPYYSNNIPYSYNNGRFYPPAFHPPLYR